MSDAEHYLKATLEIDDKLQEPALWAKAMALCEGNIKKSKYLYIKLRVEMLLADEKLVKAEQSNIPDQNLETKCNDELVEVNQAEAIEQDFEGALESKPKPFEYGGRVFPDSFTRQKALEDKKEALNKALLESYITVDAYSKKSGIKPSQIISMVRGGSHEGRLVNGQWLVSPDSSPLPKDKLNSLHKPNDELVEVNQAEAIEQDFEGALESKPKPFEYGGRVFPDSFTRQKALEDKKEALNKALLESYITVEAYSEKTGNKVAQVISKLEAGYLDGKLVNGGWLVAPDQTSMPRN